MGWSEKYKKSINCDKPKGFSQRAHCQGRKKKMNEAKEKQDHEVSMAKTQVKKSIDNLQKVARVLAKKTDADNLPAWVQAKLTDTEHNTSAAADYMGEEKNKCGEGKYWCKTDEKCKKIPKGHHVMGNGDLMKDSEHEDGGDISEGRRDGKSAKDKDYSLHDWFKGGGWVQASGKYKGKPCAKQPGQKTKPFCRDADDAAAMSTKEKERRTAKKRREDKNPERRGKAKMVSASYEIGGEQLNELWGKVALAAGAAALPYLMKRFGEKPAKKALDTHRSTKPSDYSVKGGLGAYAARSRTGGLENLPPDLKKQYMGNSYQPEGELVEDNKLKTRGGANDRIDIKFEDGTTQTIIPGKTKITGLGAKPKPKPKFGVDKTGLEGPKNPLGEEKDACYKKVKSRYKIWPSAYASGALVKCRKVGAANWGNKTKNEDYEYSNWRDDFAPMEVESVDIITPQPLQPTKGIGSEMLDEKCWDGYVQRGMKKKGKKVVPNCVKEEEKKVKRWWDDDGDGIGWEEGEVKKSKKKKKTRKEGYCNWRDELLESDDKVTNINKGKRLDAKQQAFKDMGSTPYDPNEGRRRGKRILDRLLGQPDIQDEYIPEDWQKVNKKDKTDGMSQKAVNAYRRENPGSKLKTAVTEKNPGGKRAKRRKSFCARSNGQRKMHNIDCSKTPDKAICKARKRWRC